MKRRSHCHSRRKAAVSTALACLFLAACSAVPAAPGCRTLSHVETKLFFGLSRPDGSQITQAEWQDFVATELSAVFSEGFTVVRVDGFWRDSRSDTLRSEAGRLVVRIHDGTPQDETGLQRLIERYKTAFNQQSVLRSDTPVCARF